MHDDPSTDDCSPADVPNAIDNSSACVDSLYNNRRGGSKTESKNRAHTIGWVSLKAEHLSEP